MTALITSDLREILAAASSATNLRAADIVRGSGRSIGHVPARHAVFWLLERKGHGATHIAEVFGLSRTGVQASLARIGIHGRVRDIIDATRAKLRDPRFRAERATAILRHSTESATGARD